MSTDKNPAPAGAADGQDAGIPSQPAVPAATDKPSNGAETGSADTTHDQQADDRLGFLRELGVEPEAGEDGEPKDEPKDNEPQGQDRKPEEPAEGDPQTTDQKPAEDQPLKPEDEAKLHSFGRKRIKNLEGKLKEYETKVKVSEQAVQGMTALQETAQRVGFQEGPKAVEAMVLMGRAINAKDPDALEEVGKRLIAAGWKPPVQEPQSTQRPATAPKLPAEIENVLATIEELQGKEAADLMRANLAQPKAPAESKTEQPTPQQPQVRQPQPTAAEVAAQNAIMAQSQRIQAEHKAAAPALLQEIVSRVQKVDADLIEETGFGLRPEKWEKVFRREADAVLNRHVEQSRRRPPTSERPNPPSTVTKPGSFISELMED